MKEKRVCQIENGRCKIRCEKGLQNNCKWCGEPMNDIDQINEVLKRLDALASDFLDIGAEHKDQICRYTDDSVMNAVLVFSAVLGNVFLHKMIAKDTSLKAGENLAEYFGDALHKFVLTYSGVNTKTFYDHHPD